MDGQPNTSAVWIQLITTAGTIATLVITHILTRNRADAKAAEVKADLATAKQELADAGKAREEKLDAVHEVAVKTEKIANGRLDAAMERNRALEQQVRDLGGTP
jgi:hypothetical protein